MALTAITTILACWVLQGAHASESNNKMDIYVEVPDREAHIGDTIELRCYAHAKKESELKHGAMLRWVKEIKEESKSEDESEEITYSIVATNGFIEKGYDKNRFQASIDLSTTEANSFDYILKISDVRHEDGGIYGCEDPTNDVEMYKVVKVE